MVHTLFLAMVFLVWGLGCTETKTVTEYVETPSQQDTTDGGSATIPTPIPPLSMEPGGLESAGPGGSPGALESVGPEEAMPFVVKSTTPSENGTTATLNSPIVIAFTKAMDPASVTETSFVIQNSSGAGIPGTRTVDSNAFTITFTPSADFDDGGAYTATVTTDVKDGRGIPLYQNFTLKFKTVNLDTIAVSSGNEYTLALKSNGSVWAWGRNNDGQLGDGTQTDRNKPVRVNGLTNIRAIFAGYESAMALGSDGTVWMWGNNEYGQLGDGTTTRRLTPVHVIGPGGTTTLQNITAIAAGYAIAAALKTDGTVWTWGFNTWGQLGDGTTTQRTTPVQVVSPDGTGVLQDITAIAAGYGIAALKNDGTVWTWGANWYGQLGDGTTTDSAKPVQAQGLRGVTAIACGTSHMLALTHDGSVWAWGDNYYGQLGNGVADYNNTVPRPVPAKVLGEGGTGYLTNVKAIKAGSGSGSSLAMKQDGTVWGWGNTQKNQLTFAARGGGLQATPRKITAFSNLIGMSAGGQFVTYLKNDGTVMAAGYNLHGELGNGGASFYSYHPNLMTGAPAAIAISGRHVVGADGTVWGWGSNYDCELGLPNQIGLEVMSVNQIPGLTNITNISRGAHHVLALRSDGTVWAWGRNNYGQLGLGNTTYMYCDPQQVKNAANTGPLTNITAIQAGFNHSLAIDRDGTVWAWGYNGEGELGDGTTTSRSLPAQVGGLPAPVTALSATWQSLALTGTGDVYGWGYNSTGQIGDGTKTNRLTPVKLDIANVADISAGIYSSLAAKGDGTVLAWGANWYGQLGNGTTSASTTPTPVSTLTGIVKVKAGSYDYLSAAVSADGSLWAWGANWYGQLGTGNSVDQLTPVRVLNRDGSPFTGVKAVAAQPAFTALKTDGTVWDWGFANTGPTFYLKEGEAAYSGTPVTVVWP